MHVEHLTELDRATAASWDALAHDGGLYATTAWLQAATPPDVPLTYLAARDGGELAAGVPALTLTADSSVSLFANAGRLLPLLLDLADVADAVDARGLAPTLSLGGAIPHYQSVLTAVGVNRQQALGCLVSDAVALAERAGLASVSLLYVDKHDKVADVLHEQGFVPFFAGDTYDLHLGDAVTFDDYLARFKGHRRHKLRREMTLMAATGLTFEHWPLEAAPTESMAQLLYVHKAKHGIPSTLADCRRELRANPPRRTHVFVARHEQVVVGFTMGIQWGRHLYMRTVGIEAQWGARHPIYFSLGFYEPIRFALDHNITELHYGPTVEQGKLLRGCVRTDQFGWVRALDPALHRRLERWAQRLSKGVGE